MRPAQFLSVGLTWMGHNATRTIHTLPINACRRKDPKIHFCRRVSNYSGSTPSTVQVIVAHAGRQQGRWHSLQCRSVQPELIFTRTIYTKSQTFHSSIAIIVSPACTELDLRLQVKKLLKVYPHIYLQLPCGAWPETSLLS